MSTFEHKMTLFFNIDYQLYVVFFAREFTPPHEYQRLCTVSGYFPTEPAILKIFFNLILLFYFSMIIFS